MRKAFPILCVSVLLIASALCAQAAAPKILDVQRVQLDNGLTVLLMEYHKLPLVYFRLTIKGGASLDPAGQEGITNLTADLLREGTETRTAAEIAEELDFMGASLGANASFDYTTVTAEFLRKDLDAGMALLADVVLRPAFAPEELERQRKSVLSQILRARENPASIATQNFSAALYRDHPYGRPVIGTESSVQPITREDIQRYHQTYFRPDNSILAVVGDFSKEEMLAKVGEAFGSWPKGQARRKELPGLPASPQGWQILIVDKPDVTQTQIRIGNFGIDRRNPDYYAIQVANTILGGGFTSRLVEEIRVNRGLTYGASSFFSARAQQGPFQISTFSKNATAFETIQVALEELKKYLEQGPTNEEVEKAKNYLAGQFPLSLQTSNSLAAQMSNIEFYGLPADYVDTYQEKIRSVSMDDVRRVTKKYFPYENLLLVVVTNAETMKEKLATLGDVRVKSYLEE